MATVTNPLKQLRNRIRLTPAPLKIVVGAGDVSHPLDWIPTNQEELDILKMEDFIFLFEDRKIDFVMAEHVFEHLSWYNAQTAFRNFHAYMKPGASTFRIAVPDGYHPDPRYIEHVRPKGTGPGADDHQELYNYKILTERLEAAGFRVEYLEWWDENGEFHHKPWDNEAGKIQRSLRYDERNADGKPNYTSLIVDASR